MKEVMVELLTPKQNSETTEADLERFAGRYRRILELGYIVSVPDNPLGVPRFKTTEVLAELSLPVLPDQVLLHLNTFHGKDDLDQVLKEAVSMGIRRLLVVSGDGSERLSRLKAEDLGCDARTVTSVELLQYIEREYPGAFVRGVAFNPYEPTDDEMAKLQRKIAAGAQFAITQPIFGRREDVWRLRSFKLPVAIGAWMSGNLELLAQCVGYGLAGREAYDPIANLGELNRNYPDWSVYLSMLSFKNQLMRVTDLLGVPRAQSGAG
jgi:methylenetetrahydrofolate reductase (NADPH)